MSKSPNPVTGKTTLPRALWLLAAIVLIVAVFPLPYGYYTFVRIVTCLVCIVLAHSAYYSEPRSIFWSVLFTLLAVLFNPIFPVHLSKDLWTWLDLATAFLLLGHLILVRGIKP